MVLRSVLEPDWLFDINDGKLRVPCSVDSVWSPAFILKCLTEDIYVKKIMR